MMVASRPKIVHRPTSDVVVWWMPECPPGEASSRDAEAQRKGTISMANSGTKAIDIFWLAAVRKRRRSTGVLDLLVEDVGIDEMHSSYGGCRANRNCGRMTTGGSDVLVKDESRRGARFLCFSRDRHYGNTIHMLQLSITTDPWLELYTVLANFFNFAFFPELTRDLSYIEEMCLLASTM